MYSGGEEDTGLMVAKVLFLFRVRREKQGIQEEREYAYLQFMRCAEPLDAVDRTLGCVYMCLITDDEVGHSVPERQRNRRTKKFQVGEWFGIERFGTIEGSVQLVRSNYEVQPFTSRIPY